MKPFPTQFRVYPKRIHGTADSVPVSKQDLRVTLRWLAVFMTRRLLYAPSIGSVPWECVSRLGSIVDVSHAHGDAREAHPSRKGRAGRTARPSRVRRAIPCQSHRASSGVGPGNGNRPEGIPDPLGVSSAKALWQVSNERRSPRCHVVAPRVRGVAGAHRGRRCHELPRLIRPAPPNAAIPADVASQIRPGGNMVDGR